MAYCGNRSPITGECMITACWCASAQRMSERIRVAPVMLGDKRVGTLFQLPYHEGHIFDRFVGPLVDDNAGIPTGVEP